LVFLPPYSPDLNLIEMAFAKVKSVLRRHFNGESHSVSDISDACYTITPEDAVGYFREAGYM
ncbi:hypothetical protein DICSQDRAFT_60726, partial [Dichomitus squalens LYAD-421 SS1]